MKKKYLSGLIVVSTCLALVVILFVLVPYYNRISFENHFRGIMQQLSSNESKTEVRNWFNAESNFTQLYNWVNEKLNFVPFNETFERHTVPSQILESGKGRCEEFSILYVAACLAHGYQSRLVASIDIGNPLILRGLHVWAEVKSNATWVHVDPSERRWNEPYLYENWGWGKDIGSTVKIYAFEGEKYEDVTLDYKRED